jgi:hypothetical protein
MDEKHMLLGERYITYPRTAFTQLLSIISATMRTSPTATVLAAVPKVALLGLSSIKLGSTHNNLFEKEARGVLTEDELNNALFKSAAVAFGTSLSL